MSRRSSWLLGVAALWVGSVACDDQVYSPGYHSEGWEVPAVHGAAAVSQADDCTNCHGSELEGSNEAPSCDSCHAPGWATDCSYCHAPPDDASPFVELTSTTESSFIVHDAHLTGTIWRGTDCESCHTVPESAFDAGHAWVEDDTPAHAEVDFSGLAEGGSYQGEGTCTVYCHAPTTEAEAVHTGAYADSCDGCHAWEDTLERFDELGGQHDRHLSSDGEPVYCKNCHREVVKEDGSWQDDTGSYGPGPLGVALHVDGEISIWLPGTMNGREGYAEASCTGGCHGEEHDGRSWFDD